MKPGKLNKRLEVQVPTDTTDSVGGITTAYAVDFEVWGAIIPNSGQRVFQSDRFDSEVDVLVEVRYRTDITSKHRLKNLENNNVYSVEATFDPDGRKERLNLMCKIVGDD